MGVILILALLLRIACIFLPSFGSDMNSFMAWADHMVAVGPGSFYASIWSDYAPGYLYILWLLGWIHYLVPQIPYELLLKLPAIVADMGIGYLLYGIITKFQIPNSKQTSNSKFKKIALLSAGLYLFNPAVVFNSSIWGQVDSVGALFVIAAIAASSERSWGIKGIVSFALLGVAVVIKPQMAIFVPIFLVWRVLSRVFLPASAPSTSFQSALSGTLPRVPPAIIKVMISLISLAIPVILLSWPFFPNDPIFGLYHHLQTSVATYPYTSVFAMNFWGIFGTWKSDATVLAGLAYNQWGMVAVGVVFLVATYMSYKTHKTNMIYIQTMVIVAAGVFLFATRMHERYLFVLFPLMALLVGISGRFIWFYSAGALLHFLNLYYVYTYYNPSFLKIPALTQFIGNSFGFFSLLTVLWYAVLVFQILTQKSKVPPKADQPWADKAKIVQAMNHSWFEFPHETAKPTRMQTYLLIAILIAAIFTRFWRLGEPPDYVFDEVYHAYTAQVMANNDPKAWEWWQDPPDSFAYEWTHPPFAKEAMVVGIKAFSWLPATLERIPNPGGGPPVGIEAGKPGDNPFGWRFPVAVFSVGIVLVMYRLGKELFGTTAGLIAAFLATFDGLFLVAGRTGMNDTFFLFFQLLAVLMLVKYLKAQASKYLALVGIFLGLALSSKWTALYGIGLCGFVFGIQYLVSSIASRTHTKYKILNTIYFLLGGFITFIAIPVGVYLISYIPFFLAGHNWGQFMEVQRQMWWYHTNLKATHGYQSIALSWPLLIRPVWYFVKYAEGSIANIYAMGNPVIWWAGLTAIIVAAASSAQRLAFSVRKMQDFQQFDHLTITTLAYLAFLVPWMFSPRIMFLYHYLPSLSFLILILAGVLSWLLRHSEQSRVMVIGYLLLVIGVFIYLYPHNTAMMVPTWWANQYYWLPSWR